LGCAFFFFFLRMGSGDGVRISMSLPPESFASFDLEGFRFLDVDALVGDGTG
jgi:hypothetical protein